MKKILLITSILALALSGCVKREEPSHADEELQATIQHNRAIYEAGEKLISDMAVNNSVGSYTARLLCVDGTAYVTYGGNITPHVSPKDGKPIACGNDPE